MSLFRSPREKRHWLYAGIVVITILSTLVVGQPLVDLLSDQNIQAVFFILGMLFAGAMIIVHGLRVRPSKTEIVIWLGFIAVYLMFFVRLGLPERTHLIEYSVLALFIYMALVERLGPEAHWLKAAVFSFLAATLMGVIDECIQIFLPDRVFDPVDILFNGMVALAAIGASLVLGWVRERTRKTA